MGKLKVLKYNEEKAKRIVVLLKFFELFGLFLFTFGLNRIGYLIYNNYPKFFSEFFGFEKINWFNLWVAGFVMLLLLIISLVIVWGVLILICNWLKANWRWAQIISEDKEVKAERLSEQKKLKKIRKIEKLEGQRDKYGYCVGDTMVREIEGTFGHIGGKYVVNFIHNDGNFNCKEINSVPPGKFKIVKNKLPKKPKLNTLRQEEVNSWKKVK